MVTGLRRSLAIAGLAWLSFAGAADAVGGPSDLSIDEIDPATYPAISFEVGGPGGLDGTGLDPSAITVSENGAVVEATVTRVETANLEVLLVLDTSGSMRGLPLVAAKDATAKFLNVLPAEVRVGVVGFGAKPELLAPPTTDRFSLALALDGLQAEGDTALYDAVAFAVDQFSDQAEDKAIVLLSDGGDTASLLDLETAVQSAAFGGRISVVSLVTDTTNNEALTRIAEAGGGTVSAVSDPNALGELYRATASALTNRFVVAYESAAHDETTIAVEMVTSESTLTATRTVAFPAAPVASTTTVTVPPTTVTVPATAPATTPAPLVTRAAAVDPGAARLRLALGAGAAFLALFIVVVIAMPRDRASRQVRRNLGVRLGHDVDASSHSPKERLVGTADKLVERAGRGAALARALDAAGYTLSAGEFVSVVSVVALFIAVLGLLAGGPLLAILAVVLTVIVSRAIVKWRAERRRAAFVDLLPDTLQVLTSTLRTGYGLLQALDTVTSQAQEPMQTELRRVLLDQRVGRDLVESMHDLGARMQSKDFGWVAGAIEINRDVGGDLATILDHVAATVRERRRLARQVQTLSAEGRVSAYVLLGLPPVVGVLLSLANPDYLDSLMEPVGIAMLVGSGGLMAIGWMWMRRLIRVEY